MVNPILFDMKLLKVGCPLLQASVGQGFPVSRYFPDPKDWFTEPTPDMKVFNITDAQLQELVDVGLDLLRKTKLPPKKGDEPESIA
jgi:hypothetical protein